MHAFKKKYKIGTMLQLQVSLPYKALITVVVMAVLIALVYAFDIPNPNMILIAGLVLCSALFGYGGGVIAGIIMLFYTLHFFSTDHSFTQFTDTNLQKVAVCLIGILADMLLVCSLKRAEMQAFREVDQLTEQLRRENEHLKSITFYDGLTGIRNRMALRNDYPFYNKHEVTVMMLDMDCFKEINDNLGHNEGDRALRDTAQLLSHHFGVDHCYRYGGDEFLVILPDETEETFMEKLNAVLSDKPMLKDNTRLSFSVGYVHDTLNEPHRLRALFAEADERMYANKKRAKEQRLKEK